MLNRAGNTDNILSNNHPNKSAIVGNMPVSIIVRPLFKTGLLCYFSCFL
jgi:hypothetical protein